MAKFILTNSKSKTDYSVSLSSKVGYKLSGRYEGGVIAFACFHKLSVDNENFLLVGNDFVSVIGTVIYKDSIGLESLKMIYADFDGNVNSIRDNVLGNGTFIIKKGDEITIFCEYLGLFQNFYTFNNGNLIVSNDLYDICKLCDNLEADSENIVLRALMAGVYGDETEVKSVHYLMDNEALVINTVSGEFNIKGVDADWRCYEDLNYNQVVQRIGDFLKESAAIFAKHYGVPGLSSTGGLDNRLNLASFLVNGIKPDLYYGIGNSSVTNTFNGDLAINKEYVKKFKLNLNLISWENSVPITKDWNEMEHLYGMHSVHYAGSKAFNQSYVDIKNKLLLFGCMGEIYRIDDNTYLEDTNFKDFTLDQYIDMYPIGHYWSSAQLLFKNTDRIHEHIKSKLLPLCEKWGLNPEHLSATDDFLLWMERMHRSDIYIPNLMNRHHYCAFLTSQIQIVRLLSLIHPKDKKDAKFHLDLLKYLYPEIMQVPIFSRNQFWIYDKKSNTMKRLLSARLKNIAKGIIPNSILEFLRSLFSILGLRKRKFNDSADAQSISSLRQILKRHNLIDGINVKVVPHGILSKSVVLVAQILFLFENLGIKIGKYE